MKQILIILGLFASVSTFAQSPRIKLNQITKDTVKGSVLISSPSDSGMVYSRDFYIAYGLTDTVLILYGDTLAATSGIISSVLSDGVTITGNGTTGNELKVDTSLIATIKALNDSLSTISASTTPDGVTITGDGSVGNPLKVDTATVISTIKGLVDTLSARGYLTANQTITLSGDVTGSGTTAIAATVVDDSHNHIISNIDFLQDSLNAKANDSDLANYVTLSGAETITGAKTFTNTFIQSGGDANFDSGTLYVDESANRVGIGTSSPSAMLSVYGEETFGTKDISIGNAQKNGFSALNNNLIFYANDTASLVLTHQSGTPNYRDFRVPVDYKFGWSGNNTNSQAMTANLSLYPDGNTNTIQVSDGGDANDDGKFRASAFDISSDERLKSNITDIEYGLSDIMLLQPKTYYKNNDYTKKRIGFIAQEVENYIPEVVNTPPRSDLFYSMEYDALIPVLTKAIQEQQAQIEAIQTELDAKSLIIETQEQKITDLETTIQALITRIENLENK